MPTPQSQSASVGGCAERPHLRWTDPRGSAWVAKARTLRRVHRLSEVLEIRRPGQLRQLRAEDSHRALQAFRTLSYLESRLVGLDMSWGPGGSVGYELASGIPAVRTDSDLDFILFAPEKLDMTEAQNLWRVISSAPGKVDALVETPFCGFSLKEFVATSPRKILLRTIDGRTLGSDLWHLSNGEDS